VERWGKKGEKNFTVIEYNPEKTAIKIKDTD
jgi:hypothetical protein